MKRWISGLTIFLTLLVGPRADAVARQTEYPQIIKTRYATDQKLGGSFIAFSEREKIFCDLDAKLFPGERFVEATQITRRLDQLRRRLSKSKPWSPGSGMAS
jgi:hypothetical protein